jgi:hypothetical protein
MKKLHLSVIAAILVFLLISVSTAEENNVNAMTAVVPADSIAQFIKPLLPYRIDFGENFTGEIWIKSIENIKIKKIEYFFLRIFMERISSTLRMNSTKRY